MEKSIAELKQELVPLASQVAQIKSLFAYVAAENHVPESLTYAARAATTKGYIRWSTRAKRFMFTDTGKKFNKSMKRFG